MLVEFLHFNEDGKIEILGIHEFFASHRAPALYQGTTSVGPMRPDKDLGFTGCGKMLCTKGTASAVPYKNRMDVGFSSWGTLFLPFLALSRLETAAKSRTSAAKVAQTSEVYGTAEAVPFVQRFLAGRSGGTCYFSSGSHTTSLAHDDYIAH